MAKASEQAADNAQEAIRILVVEDEIAIRRGLCDVLTYHGYAPLSAERGDEGLALARSEDVQLLVLDVMMPGLDGFQVCEQVRDVKPDLPVLMLTARGAEEDILRGFRCGADDYVTKPFSIAELVARVEALLRRSGRGPNGEAGPDEPFAFGPWQIEPAGLCAVRGQSRIELTRREIDILSLLIQEPGRIISRRRLLKDLWGYATPDRVETRTVDMHIAKLRKKLGLAARDAALIETVRGEGYRSSG